MAILPKKWRIHGYPLNLFKKLRTYSVEAQFGQNIKFSDVDEHLWKSDHEKNSLLGPNSDQICLKIWPNSDQICLKIWPF